MNWRTDIKAGDRIRLTLEGVVLGGNSPHSVLRFLPDTGDASYFNTFRAKVLDAPTTKIEKLQRPIKVGDKVKAAYSGCRGEVIAICDEEAWVRHASTGCTTLPLSDLELVE